MNNRNTPRLTAYAPAAPTRLIPYRLPAPTKSHESPTPETRVRRYASVWDRLLGTVAAELVADHRFEELVRKWRKRTAAMSSLDAAASDPAYREIIRIGEPAIPLILKELGRDGSVWFRALVELAGSDHAAGCQTVPEAIARWRAWGELRQQA